LRCSSETYNIILLGSTVIEVFLLLAHARLLTCISACRKIITYFSLKKKL
jgi:hypothetical protein